MSGDYYKTLQSYGIKALCFSRLRGKANNEFNLKTPVPEFAPYYEDGIFVKNDGYMIPFGDGPSPMFKYRVAETMIMNMLNQAEDYVYLMSPYLIIDNELCQTIENAAYS